MLLSSEPTAPQDTPSSITDIQYVILKTYIDHNSHKSALEDSTLAARTE